MSRRPDFYRVLQVDSGADPEVIDAAYRKLAAKYHPDHGGDDDSEERMKAINEAYEVLSDPSKRARYDRGRWLGGGGTGGGDRAGRSVTWLRYLVPLLMLGMTLAGFRVNPRVGVILAAAFVVYGLLRAFRRRL
ncbi:MAG: DnaJ domain-containing protein [Deltaproteobacteria bacterium]|nr:DnaJ domain-containing protein [Deltaproteobacteria bacterium]